MKILKFGGTSVGSTESLRQVIQIVLNETQAEPVAVVVSALSGITNDLILATDLASKENYEFLEVFKKIRLRHLEFTKTLITDQKLYAQTDSQIQFLLAELHNILNSLFFLRESTTKALDLVSSFGERLSATVVAGALNCGGGEGEFLDARTLVQTDEHFGRARVDFAKTNDYIRQYFKEHAKTQIITGFIGSTAKGATTTLGRGGSDYTASIFGAALQASEIQIWTDVDGVMTADPRKVQTAFPLKYLSYQGAMEISYLGAKVLYPPTIQPVLDKKIPLRIKNTFNPDLPGTLISLENPEKSHGQTLIKSLPSMTKVALLSVQGTGLRGVSGTSGRLFKTLGESNINVILISQTSSEYAITFAIQEEQAELAKQIVHDEFAAEIANKEMDEVVVQTDLAIVSVVSKKTDYNSQILAKLYQTLHQKEILAEAIAQGGSKLNISTVIAQEKETELLQALHQTFFSC
jgi:bifunctional aspartokinase / homoserine dehydrogenase 1